MNSYNSQIEKLIQTLYTLSQKDKLDWQESANDGSFYVAFPTYSVVLTQSITGSVIGVEVLNESGRIIESVTVRDIPDLPDMSLFPQVQKLYELARKKALKTDEIMTDLLESLNEML